MGEPSNPSEKNLALWPCLPTSGQLAQTQLICARSYRAHKYACVSVCVCVCAHMFGFHSSTYEKYSRGKDNAPMAGKDEIICKWLVKAHIIFLISGSETASLRADAIYHVIIYLGAF